MTAMEPEGGMAGVGARIEALRRRKRWSRNDLAQEAGVSRQYVGEIEKDEKTNPSVAVLERIARALGWASFHEMLESEELEPPVQVAPAEPAREGQLSSELMAAIDRMLEERFGQLM